MTSPRNPQPSSARDLLGEELRRALVAAVRKRVPESDVEDVVQATLAEAIESPHAPDDPEQLRRWIFGVARNKVVDLHRRRGRETFDLPEDLAHAPAPHDEADLLRWAERRLPPGEEPQKTLEWMLREGDGEKLEAIAESEKVPAPRVRQRVSRLRRHLKANWQREVALLAAVGVVITMLVLAMRKREPEPIAHDPNAQRNERKERAERLRADALDACRSRAWDMCVSGLDAAKALDPAGDDTPAVSAARRAAQEATTPPPAPVVEPPNTKDSVAPPVKPTAPLSTTSKVAPTAVPVPKAPAKTKPPAPTKPMSTSEWERSVNEAMGSSLGTSGVQPKKGK